MLPRPARLSQGFYITVTVFLVTERVAHLERGQAPIWHQLLRTFKSTLPGFNIPQTYQAGGDSHWLKKPDHQTLRKRSRFRSSSCDDQ